MYKLLYFVDNVRGIVYLFLLFYFSSRFNEMLQYSKVKNSKICGIFFFFMLVSKIYRIYNARHL